MPPAEKAPAVTKVVIIVLLALALGAYFIWGQPRDTVPAPDNTGTPTLIGEDRIELSLGVTGTLNGVTLTPRAVVEDSRCPQDVQCIQAGTVRVRTTLSSGLGTADQVFLLGEPITTEAEAVTLLEVKPAPVSTATIESSEYRFIFKVEKRLITYVNASADLIRVDTPPPGAVVGKTFRITGQARGKWFFEASFPIDVRDQSGKKLVTVVAQAEGEWMTTDFVPFAATVTIPSSYIGPATLVLNRDNASGLPEHDASISYPITIEY